MPYCLNHKISLSLGNKASPEREERHKERREKHKAYLTEVVACLLSPLRERAFSLAFLSSHFGTAVGKHSDSYFCLQQGLFYLLAVGFTVIVHSLLSNQVHNVELRYSVFRM